MADTFVDGDDEGMLVCRHLCGHRGASCGTALLDIRRPPFDDDYCNDYDGCNDCHEYENDMNSPLYDIITKWYVVAQIKQIFFRRADDDDVIGFFQGTCQLLGTRATPRLSSFTPENLVCHSKYVAFVFCQLNLPLFGL